MKKFENTNTSLSESGSKLRHRLRRAVGFTAVRQKVEAFAETKEKLTQRYGEKPTKLIRGIENSVETHFTEAEEAIKAAADKDPSKAEYSLAALDMARRMEGLFAEGGNDHTFLVDPYNGGSISKLKHELNQSQIPEWLAKGTENGITDAPLEAWVERSVSIAKDDRGETSYGEPTYRIIVQRWEQEQGRMPRGVRSEITYRGSDQLYESGKSVANPDYMLHGKPKGIAGAQYLHLDVTPAKIATILAE